MLKHYFEKYRQFIPLICIAFLILIIAIFAVNMVTADHSVTINEPPVNALEVADEGGEDIAPVPDIADHVFVEVRGAVKNPGVYEVPVDARVTDVLSMAAVWDGADLLTVNKSETVSDEMVLYVPAGGEAAEGALLTSLATAEEEVELNIDTASIDELTQLHGIGEKKAQLIFDYRDENGLFMTKEDLMNISGS